MTAAVPTAATLPGAAPVRRALRAGSTRLLLAAALCVASLGVGWGATSESEGYVTSGYIVPNGYVSPITGEYSPGAGQYYAGSYVPGTPGAESPGFESDARVLLAPAMVGLVLAVRKRTGTRRSTQVARWSTIALAAAAALAIGTAATTAAVVATVAAFVVAASVTWPLFASRLARLADLPRQDPTEEPLAPTVAPTAF